ncbi:hypothetical protein SmJEL517_g01359 [Synchytrium microbalum]|uniref:F-box domain-containing protein n=1 Tax=Synchytrium microbalum TaxID=1806994 RepID=A0A507CG07_9FUNG|nr:uncharacterized protein SmJEL517_g01359 [Synchytrium microbalum]TPX36515.1 hypothetical protein SmJEL517_g01359 [Synchytrium microbalum]
MQTNPVDDEGFDESHTMPHTVAQFDTEEQKAEYAFLLLSTVSTATLANVTNRLVPLLQRDFVYLLPQELAIQILSCTDARTVGRAAQVSKTWKRITSDNAIWRALYRKNGWTVNEQFLDQWTNKPLPIMPPTFTKGKSLPDSDVPQQEASEEGTMWNTEDYGSGPRSGNRPTNPASADIGDHDPTAWGDDGTGSASGSVPRRPRRGTDDGGAAGSSGSNNPINDPTLDEDDGYSHSIGRRPSLFQSPVPTDDLQSTLRRDGVFSGQSSSSLPRSPPDSLPRPSAAMSLPRLGNTGPSDSLARALAPTSLSLPRTMDVSPNNLAESLEQTSISEHSTTTGGILVKPLTRSLTDNWDRHAHLDWRYIYQQRARLEKNWTEGIFNVRELAGHFEAIYCLQFDESKIVSGSRDDTIKIWDMKTGECTKTLHGHGASVLCLQYDDQYIVSGSSDSTVIVWDITTSEPKKVLRSHTESVLNLRFDKRYIASCSKDKTIKLWNTSTGDLIRTLRGHRAAVNAIQFSEDLVVSASGDRTIKVWRISTGDLVRTLSGHSRGIACIHFEGNIIVSGSSDRTIRTWDVNTGMCLQTVSGHTELVRTLQFDNHRIVSGSYDVTLKVWDYPKGNLILDLKNGHSQKVFKLQFNDTKIVSCSQDQRILVWDFSQGVDTRFFV